MELSDGLLSTLAPAVHTVLIVGVGYVTVWAKFRFVNLSRRLSHERKKNFYDLKPYDKAMQSLIAGLIVMAISGLVSLTPYEILSDLSTFLNSENLIRFLVAELFFIFYSAFIWSGIELVVINRKHLKKLKKEEQKSLFKILVEHFRDYG